MAKVFEANPANCPSESVVGHAKALTPILPVPLEGPAYFVSHGGEAFPSLIVVLQGYGVTVDLVGTTFISKAGITSSTFKTVPDVPVGSFELNLPTGKYSALGANLPTPKGIDANPILIALMQWGDHHTPPPAGPPRVHVHTACGHDAHPKLVCAHCDETIRPTELKVRPGPGANPQQQAEPLLPPPIRAHTTRTAARPAARVD